jgi:hypothetical protein
MMALVPLKAEEERPALAAAGSAGLVMPSTML